MLTFEQTKKAVPLAWMYGSEECSGNPKVLYYLQKTSGPPSIECDDLGTLLLPEKLDIMREFGLSEREWATLLLAVDEGEFQHDAPRVLKKAYHHMSNFQPALIPFF